jgi:cytochrome c-type biogenesis protein CcmF
MSGIFCFASIYLIIQTCDYALLESKYCSQSISIKKLALFLGHFGFGFLALSITLNASLSKDIEFIGKVGARVENKDLIVRLENVKFTDADNYFRQIAEFSIEDRNNNITILQPENRLYKVENSLSQEVDIYSYLSHDVYAVLSQIDKKKTVHAMIHYQPFISFIWFSVLLMSGGFLMLLFRR